MSLGRKKFTAKVEVSLYIEAETQEEADRAAKEWSGHYSTISGSYHLQKMKKTKVLSVEPRKSAYVPD